MALYFFVNLTSMNSFEANEVIKILKYSLLLKGMKMREEKLKNLKINFDALLVLRFI